MRNYYFCSVYDKLPFGKFKGQPIGYVMRTNAQYRGFLTTRENITITFNILDIYKSKY